jgi:hypothetical protein
MSDLTIVLSHYSTNKHIQRSLLIALFVLLSLFISFSTIPFAGEFHDFYTAGRALASGQSPYSIARYYNPIWVAALFAPLSLLPEQLAWRLYCGVSLAAYFMLLAKFAANKRILIATCLSPFIVLAIINGNLEWLVLIGFVLPIQFGVWLMLMKPQMVIALIPFLAWRMLREQGVKRVLLVFGPPGAALLLSLALGMRAPDPATVAGWNVSLWPIGIVVGLALLIAAFKRSDQALALAAGPFLSPYTSITSYAALLPAAMHRERWTYALVGLAYIVEAVMFLN